MPTENLFRKLSLIQENRYIKSKVKLEKNKRKTQLKRKLSYSISKNKVGEDGAAKVEIKIVVPTEIKHHVSMSRIVDYAIQSFLKELKSAAEE